MTELRVIHYDDVPVEEFPGGAHYRKIITGTNDGSPVVTGIQISPPGYATPDHSHPYVEIVSVLEGEAEAWFNPIVPDVKDLRIGVGSGGIQAQENPLTNFYNFGLYNHHPHVTMSGHFFGVAGFFCNADNYEAWPMDVQDVVDRAARIATLKQRQMATAEDDSVLCKLAPTAVEIIHLSKAERAVFIRTLTPLIEEQRSALGSELFNLLG